MTAWLTCLNCFSVETAAEQVQTTDDHHGVVYRCHACDRHENTLVPQGMGAIDSVDTFAYVTSDGVKLLRQNQKQEQRQ